MACWEWMRKTSIDKRIDTQHGALNSDGSFGTRYEYEPTSPERTETFSAHGISWDEIQPFIDLVVIPLPAQTASTLVDRNGRQWQGKIYRCESAPLAGVDKFDASVVMKYAVKL